MKTKIIPKKEILTNKELIAILSEYPEDAEIFLGYDLWATISGREERLMSFGKIPYKISYETNIHMESPEYNRRPESTGGWSREMDELTFKGILIQ